MSQQSEQTGQAPDANEQTSTQATEGASDAAAGAQEGIENPEEAASKVGDSIATGLDSIGERVTRVVEDPTLDTAVSAFGPLLVDAGLAIIGLAVLLVVTSFLSRATRRFAGAGLRHLSLEKTVVSFLSRAAGIAIWVLAVPVALEIFGIKTASFAAVIGAAGLAIGLAMQGALSNIAAGIMLLVLRPFKIGDWVELDDELGVVRDVGIFYTLVDTFANKLVYLPNAEVLGAKIEHFTANKTRRVDVPVGVAYGTDLKKAMGVLEDVVKDASSSPKEDELPMVILTGFGASSIDFEARVWCPSEEFLQARTDLVLKVERALDEAGVEIPFPQRTLTFKDPLRVNSSEQADDNAGDGE